MDPDIQSVLLCCKSKSLDLGQWTVLFQEERHLLGATMGSEYNPFQSTIGKMIAKATKDISTKCPLTKPDLQGQNPSFGHITMIETGSDWASESTRELRRKWFDSSILVAEFLPSIAGNSSSRDGGRGPELLILATIQGGAIAAVNLDRLRKMSRERRRESSQVYALGFALKNSVIVTHDQKVFDSQCQALDLYCGRPSPLIQLAPPATTSDGDDNANQPDTYPHWCRSMIKTLPDAAEDLLPHFKVEDEDGKPVYGFFRDPTADDGLGMLQSSLIHCIIQGLIMEFSTFCTLRLDAKDFDRSTTDFYSLCHQLYLTYEHNYDHGAAPGEDDEADFPFPALDSDDDEDVVLQQLKEDLIQDKINLETIKERVSRKNFSLVLKRLSGLHP